MAISINPISDVFVTKNSDNIIVNLSNNFDDTFTTGLVATFQLYDTSVGNNGTTNVLLFDQEGDGAPLAVQNFTDYVDSGSYVNTIIHRSVPDFIIQGGGFTVNNLQVDEIPTNPPVQNEFSSNRSNLRGTIANAKLGDQPNSATNQWFFNLADNSGNLDTQNEGFTVFGEVLPQDLVTVDAIAQVPIFNGNGLNPAFTDLPLNLDPNNPSLQEDDDFVRYQSITVSDEEELSFDVINNSRPDLVDVSVNDNNELVIDYFADSLETAEITVSATNLLGEEVTDTFNVSGVQSSNPDLQTPIFRFQNTDLTGTYLYAGEEESKSIRENNPNFKEEGLAFFVGVEANDDLIPLYRFQNSSVPGTYLYAGEEERQSILQNDTNFREEGLAFYVHGVGANKGESFYRFQNSDLLGTYIFVAEQERQSIIENNPNFLLEGPAFEVGV